MSTKITLRVTATSGSVLSVTHELLQPNPLFSELTAEYQTDIRSGGTMYNDDNGLLMKARKLDSELPIAASFHAVVQSAFLVDTEDSYSQRRQVAILVPHATGAASLSEGKLELVLQRRLNTTDNQGPWPMDDGDDPISTVSHGVFFGAFGASEPDRIRKALELENPLLVEPLCVSCHAQPFSPLRPGIFDAQGAHVMSLKARAANPPRIILQVQNVNENSSPVTIDASPASIFNAAVVVPTSACNAHTLTLQSKLEPCSNDSLILEPAPSISTFVLDFL